MHTELSGELTAVGLRPLVDFLSDLKKTGRLLVRDTQWTGTIGLLDGRIVGANFADEEGLTALDAIFVALQHGSFEFNSTAECEHNVLVPPLGLTEHLDKLDAEVRQLADLVNSLSAVPDHIEPIPDGEITLTRSSLALLLAVDGRRTVADHARERGLLATLRQLSELIRLGLVGMHSPPSEVDMPPAPVREPVTPSFRARANSNLVRTDGAALASPKVNFFRRA